MPITAEKNNDGSIVLHGTAYNITEAKNTALEPYGKQVHDYGLVLRLLPDEKQIQAINQQIGNARFVYNRYLNDRIQYYNDNKKALTVSAYKKCYLPLLKEECPFLKLSDKFAIESALEHMDTAYKNFFNGSGFPKYKSKQKPSGNSYSTKYTNNNIRIEQDDNGSFYVKLPKIGLVNCVMPKGQTISTLIPSGTSILRATVKKSSGIYEVSLQLETIIDKIQIMTSCHVSDILAIDLGLKDFLTIGDGSGYLSIKNPRWIKVHSKKLRRFQKALSRKQYDSKTHTGSKNWEKAKLRVAREQRKTANQRKDFHHKLSRAIADSCSVLVCEDLNIKGMMKNKRLSKAIASVGWGNFLVILQYKMSAQGKHFVKVDKWFPSSQLCSLCGYKNTNVKDLTVREWTCPKCGAYHDRDGNAAANMLKEGIRILKEKDITINNSPAAAAA